MIRLENISLAFGAQSIFKEISWHIRQSDRIGLVGPNGVGKTTLLRILLGKQFIDSGKIQKATESQVGYLPQETAKLKGKTLLEETLSTFYTILEMEKEIRSLHQKIDDAANKNENHEQLLRRLGTLQSQFENADGFRLEHEAKKILKGLGFQEEDWNKETSAFSGGWQMRISLAKLLLLRPNLLMLDEPTNHLDIETTEWVENYLKRYEGAFILVSHDRYFLDRTVKKIVAIDRGELKFYAGNYSYYKKEREKQLQILWKEYYQQKDEVEKIQKFIDRFRYKATKAAQVQSRVKMLEKIKVVQPPEDEIGVHFQFPSAPTSGKLMLKLENVAKSYNENRVFSGVSFRCDRGVRMALVGVNGAGKSTLCRILAKIDQQHEGEIHYDSRAKIGYYSQEVADQLSSDQTVLEEAQEKAGNLTPNRVRSILGAFLFRKDDVYKKVHVLSGGEKSRLALACILFQSANLLVLDEPTNHLDLNSKNILSKALDAFDGTILLVSHDRYFLDKIVNRVVEISDGKIHQFWGDYTEYLSKKEMERLAEEEQKNNVDELNPQDEAIAGKKKGKEQKRVEAEERNKRFHQRKDFAIRLKVLEKEIEKTELKKEELENKLANPETFKNGSDVQKIQVDFSYVSKSLQTLYEEWEKVGEKIEQINKAV